MTAIIAEAPVGRREARRIDRRAAIVAAARESFLEHGYAGTSMSGLLKTLGGSKATLWGYFRSKEDLFGAVVEAVTASFRADLAAAFALADELEPAIVAFCRTFLRAIETPEALATWRLIAAESGRFPEIGRIFYDRAPRAIEAALVPFLARHIARGALRDEDPLAMARTLTSLCKGRQNRLMWGVEQEGDAPREAHAAASARIFLRAFVTGAG